MKLVFWGNSLFSLKPLEALAEAFDVAALVTAPDTVVGRGMKTPRSNPVKEFALQRGIPLLQPAKLKKNPAFVEELRAIGAELHVLVSYGKIIPPEIFTLPPLGMINLHASLLPSLRGASPIQFALWQGLEETGNTVQYIAAGMDEGDVLAQRSLPIEENDDYFTLEDKLSRGGAALLAETVKALAGGLPSLPQNHDDATYCSLISKEDGMVDFAMTAEEIVRAFKALRQFPGIYLAPAAGGLKILECSCLPAVEPHPRKGTILGIGPEGLAVACHESALLIGRVQAAGKKPCPARDYANGIRLKRGDILG